ncbi:hypothetical protein DPMN_083593 [Dreissena polymorpha]|uniref:Uncharacterized protein n=1 Tax=Dreissena polymorpha TaxID=45954 RepID=A0A9D4BHU8_DREPO|nr:hypothetical protein DPMN_083593 [Dreissena polymorpha]
MRGHVQELATEMDDPDHSLDIKRGLISLLELNFNERQSLDSDRPVIRDDGKPVIYRVIEVSCQWTTRLFMPPDRMIGDKLFLASLSLCHSVQKL